MKNYPEYSAVSLSPQPPVVDDQRIHGTELVIQCQLLDGRALKRHPLGGLSIMWEEWAVERWSVNTSILSPRVGSDSACFLVVS